MDQNLMQHAHDLDLEEDAPLRRRLVPALVIALIVVVALLGLGTAVLLGAGVDLALGQPEHPVLVFLDPAGDPAVIHENLQSEAAASGQPAAAAPVDAVSEAAAPAPVASLPEGAQGLICTGAECVALICADGETRQDCRSETLPLDCQGAELSQLCLNLIAAGLQCDAAGCRFDLSLGPLLCNEYVCLPRPDLDILCYQGECADLAGYPLDVELLAALPAELPDLSVGVQNGGEGLGAQVDLGGETGASVAVNVGEDGSLEAGVDLNLPGGGSEPPATGLGGVVETVTGLLPGGSPPADPPPAGGEEPADPPTVVETVTETVTGLLGGLFGH